MSPAWRTLKLPLALILLWCLLLFALYHWTVRREDEYTRELALLQTRTLFSSLVDVRAWNAVNGGVWVQEGAACPANPWLPEAERRLSTADGKRLVKVNPSYHDAPDRGGHLLSSGQFPHLRSCAHAA